MSSSEEVRRKYSSSVRDPAEFCSDQARPASANEIEFDDASLESLRPNETDTGHSEGHGEATEASDTEHEVTFIHSQKNDSVIAGDSVGEAAMANRRENDSIITAAAIQTVKADKDDVLPNPLPLLKQPDFRRVSQEQLTAEGKGIYAGLVKIECKCIEVDNSQDAPIHDPLDFTRFLERIPHRKLALL
ncbi:hypothetical protein F5883DRAFT_588769 [Diaporthe sp. PMI_573]|nr:hypothetical protein F5883DRAFT_588769 [Diaporthaceae sp. PMI_573]